MSWKRDHAQALAPPNATPKPAGGSRKQPSNLTRKPRFNAAVYAPGIADVNDGATVWRTHDPTTDPFVSTAREHTPKSVSSTSSSPMRASSRKSGGTVASMRSIGTQTPASAELQQETSPMQGGPGSWRDVVKDVHAMPAATVDYLLGVLTERKHALMSVPHAAPTSNADETAPANASSRHNHTKPPPVPLSVSIPPPSHSPASSPLSEGNGDGDDSHEDALTPPRRRTGSYEALVQLEAILETRHRQLMANGVLDEANIHDELHRLHHHQPRRDDVLPRSARHPSEGGDMRALDLVETWSLVDHRVENDHSK